MRIRHLQRVGLLLLVMYLNSCSSIYSPFVHLPVAPLRSGEGEWVGGLGSFPEARPNGIGARQTRAGEMLGRYAVTDNVTIQGRIWEDLDALPKFQLRGTSLEALIQLNDSSNSVRYTLIPREMILFGGSAVQGAGGGVSLGVSLPNALGFTPYAALGVGLGTSTSSPNGWGVAAISNLGAAIPIMRAVSLNLELAAPFEWNRQDNIWTGTIAPSAALSVKF